MPLIKRDDFSATREAEEISALQLSLEADNALLIEKEIANGHRRGVEKGLVEARAMFSETINSLCSFNEDLEQALEETVLGLVAECLKKIAGEDIQPDTTRAIVRSVITSSVGSPPSRLLVSPEDSKIMRELLDNANLIKVEEDSSLAAGEILMISPLGRRRLGLRDQITALLGQLRPDQGRS